MKRFPQALYKFPGAHQLEDGLYDVLAVQGDVQLDEALADGWHEHMSTAKAAHELALQAAHEAEAKTVAGVSKKPDPDEQAVEVDDPRTELEAKATALGLKFDGRIGDKKLAALVAEAEAKTAG